MAPEDKSKVNETAGEPARNLEQDPAVPVTSPSGDKLVTACNRDCNMPTQPINHQYLGQMLSDKNLIYQDGNQKVYMLCDSTDIAQLLNSRSDDKSTEFNRVNYWNQATTGVESPKQHTLLEEINSRLQTIEKKLGRLESFLMRIESALNLPPNEPSEL